MAEGGNPEVPNDHILKWFDNNEEEEAQNPNETQPFQPGGVSTPCHEISSFEALFMLMTNLSCSKEQKNS